MVPISVSGKKRDWLGLESKISRGLSLEEAARQAGIPLEEIYQYVTEKMGQVDTVNWQLRCMAQAGLEKSLTKLKELASGDAREGRFFESTDLLAAQALAKVSMDAMRLALNGAGKKDKDETQRDLFDRQDDDPWRIKKIE